MISRSLYPFLSSFINHSFAFFSCIAQLLYYQQNCYCGGQCLLDTEPCGQRIVLRPNSHELPRPVSLLSRCLSAIHSTSAVRTPVVRRPPGSDLRWVEKLRSLSPEIRTSCVRTCNVLSPSVYWHLPSNFSPRDQSFYPRLIYLTTALHIFPLSP